MKPVKLIDVSESKNKLKKYDATFLYDDGSERKVSFGAKGYSDYLTHKDPERRDRYVLRHSAVERLLWKKHPDSPAALSRWILWPDGPAPSLEEAVRHYRIQFSL